MSRGLRVLEAGACTLIVDAGRSGHCALGVPQGGAADSELWAAALLCTGAAPEAAALELTLRGPMLECLDATCRVALGGDCHARIHRATGGVEQLPGWSAAELAPGDRLACGAVRGGARAYLAVDGGIDVAPQLGSRSSSLRGAADGILGRALRAGDELPLGARRDSGALRRLSPPPWLLDDGPLRVVVGPQDAAVGAAAIAALLRSSWRVSQHSDRTGVRLEGEPLPLGGATDVAPQGCPPGAVQVGGDGLPILLGCERGTTGGYAVPATLASVDLPRLGRLRPGHEVRLRAVSVEEAVRLRRRRAELMATLADGLAPMPG